MKRRFAPLLIIALTSLIAGCGKINVDSSSLELQSSSTESSSVEISSSSESSVEESSSSVESSSSFEKKLVSSIVLNYEEYSLALKKTVTLKATVSPDDAWYKSVAWTSSDTSIVSVDTKGLCYGWKIGTATITCTAKDDSGVSASCTITVYEVEATSVTLGEHSKELYPDESFSLSASISPSDASDKTITYESSDESVAEVSSTGVVTAIAPGKATITASASNGVNDSCEVTVKAIQIKSFSLRKQEVSLHVDDTYELTPIFTPENASDKSLAYSSDNEGVATVENGVIKAVSVGNATITVVTNDGGFTSTCAVSVVSDDSLVKTPINKTYQDYGHNSIYGTVSTPSTGKAKILVVPVWLSDSTNYISASKKSSVRDDIEKSFFGTSEETGWESVSSFYSKASFGKYEFDGMVTDWFDCGLSTSYLGNSSKGESRVEDLTSSCISFIKKKYNWDTLSDYDQDGDGYLDGLIMIYAAPDYSQANESYDNLWAYTYWMAENEASLDDPTVNAFHWASYDFMYSSGDETKEITGKSSYGSGDTSHCLVDAHTFIHETGHMLGLDDYYDYSGQYSPSGAFLMQDYNVGGQDPFSTMALGWADPYIPTESTTISIKPFEESGDMILLSPSFNSFSSPFDEYLLLELYSPTGLNEMDCTYQYSGVYPQGPNEYGIRVWHVDARLVYSTSYRNISASKITTNPSTSSGYVATMMSNTYYYDGSESISILGKNYANYNLLQLIRNDTADTYKPKYALSEGDLFYEGDTFTMDKFSSQFVNKTELNNKSDLGWSFTVNSIDENGASISLTKN